MILEFSISNFRSIKEKQTLSFEATSDTHLEDYYVIQMGQYRILKMATIMGANASGKSNILQAFSLIHNLLLVPCETRTSTINYSKFALSPEYADKNSTMEVTFICNEKKYIYAVEFNNNSVVHESLQCQPFEKRTHKVYERFTDSTTQTSTIIFGSTYPTSPIKDLKVNLLHNRTLFGSYQTSNVDVPWLKEITDWINDYMLPPVKANSQLEEFTSKQIAENKVRKETIAQLLRKSDVGVSDFTIEKVTENLPKAIVHFLLSNEDIPAELRKQLQENPTSERLKVHLLHKGESGDVPFDFNEESNGTRRYYGLAGVLMLLIQESHFITIDELECRLHPDLYQYIINLFLINSKHSQMVFTTHYRDFLNDKDFFRDDAVWFAEKSELGETSIYSLADFGSDTLRNSTNRYNAYRSGRLGAIPNTGSTYIDVHSKNESNAEIE